MDGATVGQLSAVVLRLSFEVVGAAYEEAMRTHGIMPDTVKVISANARANLDALNEADSEALIQQPESLPVDQRPRISPEGSGPD